MIKRKMVSNGKKERVIFEIEATIPQQDEKKVNELKEYKKFIDDIPVREVLNYGI